MQTMSRECKKGNVFILDMIMNNFYTLTKEIKDY